LDFSNRASKDCDDSHAILAQGAITYRSDSPLADRALLEDIHVAAGP
jgi:hypothetical protein